VIRKVCARCGRVFMAQPGTEPQLRRAVYCNHGCQRATEGRASIYSFATGEGIPLPGVANLRREHWCSWDRGGSNECRRRKDLVAAVDEHGVVLRTVQGWSRSYCPAHLEAGTLEMRERAARALKAAVKSQPTVVDRFVYFTTDLPNEIARGLGPYGGAPMSAEYRTMGRWYLWLFFYGPIIFIGFLALKQHFFGP